MADVEKGRHANSETSDHLAEKLEEVSTTFVYGAASETTSNRHIHPKAIGAKAPKRSVAREAVLLHVWRIISALSRRPLWWRISSALSQRPLFFSRMSSAQSRRPQFVGCTQSRRN
jgi:hypothetical protein